MGFIPEGRLKCSQGLGLLCVQLGRQKERCPEHGPLVFRQRYRKHYLKCDAQVSLQGTTTLKNPQHASISGCKPDFNKF